jgi:hypothetical protein
VTRSGPYPASKPRAALTDQTARTHQHQRRTTGTVRCLSFHDKPPHPFPTLLLHFHIHIQYAIATTVYLPVIHPHSPSRTDRNPPAVSLPLVASFWLVLDPPLGLRVRAAACQTPAYRAPGSLPSSSFRSNSLHLHPSSTTSSPRNSRTIHRDRVSGVSLVYLRGTCEPHT